MASDEIRVTTEVLLRGTVIFIILDLVFVSLLSRLVSPSDLKKLKWRLIGFMVLFFFLLFGIIMSTIFWEPVYSYVFPEWARWIIPPVYGLLFGAAGLFFWWLAFKLPFNAVVSFCLFGGVWGIATHIWAVFRGILDKPPMLQGSEPWAAVMIAAFEFIFYWCICVAVVVFSESFINKLKKKTDLP